LEYLSDLIKEVAREVFRHNTKVLQMRNAYKTLVGKPEGKNHLEDLRVDGRY
jgi:hypothetical protein